MLATIQASSSSRAEEQGSSAKAFVASAGNTAQEDNEANRTKVNPAAAVCITLTFGASDASSCLGGDGNVKTNKAK